MTDNSELKRAASSAKNWGGEVGEGRWYAAECFKRPYFSAQDAEFIAACDPGRVLALIAENDHLAMCARQWEEAAMQWGAERDQLRAEVAGLKTGYEAYERVNAELKAECEALRQIISDSATSCGAAVSVECTLEFMGHLPGEIFSVISKLRNALAECADSLHGEMLQKFGGQLPGDMHPVTRREYDRDMAEVAGYRAALGQGEPS